MRVGDGLSFGPMSLGSQSLTLPRDERGDEGVIAEIFWR